MTQVNHRGELEIFIDDLTPEAQKEALEYLKIEKAEDGNLDVFPIATICTEERVNEG